jgi:hypothetical protein
MKIPPVKAEMFHTDGRSELTKLIGTFRNFANAPKNNVFYNASALVDCYRLGTNASLVPPVMLLASKS